ncbi:M48 family metallopeptidase [Pseudodesulfovibrio sp.]|uniref:M48 family metallopeptidase n=1 Tax=Pseudodesulfovibrio sp. TaxID=2035812 RepID=UPI002606B12A|nr:M48 family metallopeptidase [Pseudodesulfovibrio sp.]MDD3311637.1 M48 family metalloprotease [Pseudodesulfovibrio sp.]
MRRINVQRRQTRREFLRAGALAALGLAAGPVLWGCAKNPVTGQNQFMLVSQEQEIAMDKQAAPHQLSADYGQVGDTSLNDYVSGVGQRLAAVSHRPDMPYSFHVVNANYVNAYAFPGGTIACTRGILLGVESEAELAGLLGHEIGHVNARHTASRMSTQMVVGGLAGIGGAVVGAKYGKGWGALAGGLGGFGVGALLASYSRDDERQADALGMEYMTRAGYNPDGMVDLMDMLNDQHDSEPSAIEVMFATHPMSGERLATARKQAMTKYASAGEYRLYRERYMDNTAALRRIGPAIKEMQDGEKLMREEKYAQAETTFASALKKAPDDYAGLLLMAKCRIAMEQFGEARSYAEQARRAYPAEAQAMQLAGLLQVKAKRFDAAYEDFDAYEKALPGNPYTIFYKGYCQEGMGRRPEAAQEYVRFLNQVNEGDQAKYAYYKLVEWGYIRGQATPPADPFAGLG